MKGWTLIELIMTIVLISIIGGIAVWMLGQNYNNYFVAKQIIGLANSTNTTLTALLREIRAAESITSMNSHALTFTNQQGNSIAYSLSGSNILRSVNGATAQIVNNTATNITFTYYDANLATTATSSNVQYLALRLDVNNGLPYSLLSGVTLRKNLPLGYF